MVKLNGAMFWTAIVDARVQVADGNRALPEKTEIPSCKVQILARR